MCAAPAEIAGEALFDLVECGVGCFLQQGGCSHDHAAGAVAALRRLFGDEGGLDGVRLFRRTETFERGDGVSGYLFDRGDAGSDGLVVNHDCTGTTLCQAAAEFGTVEVEFVS